MILDHEPISTRPYRPPGERAPRKRPPRLRLRRIAAATLALAALAGSAWLVAERIHLVGFETDPIEATARVEGPHVMVGEKALLWSGRHVVDVSAEGHRSRRVEFEAETARGVVRVTLDPLPGKLRVSTTPETDGEVLVDGERAGKVGETLEGLAPGIHVARVRAEGFEEARRTVEVEGYGRLTEIEIPLSEVVAPATLAVASAPEGADILIDGAWKGRAPKRFRFAPGAEVEVVVALPGHVPNSRTLKLASGPREHAVTLTPRDGSLDLRPNPANATVRVNGRIETRRQLRLPQKAHVIEVSAPDYLPGKYTVTPHPEEPKILSAVLRSRTEAERDRRSKRERDLGLVFVEFRPYESFEIATTRRRVPVRLTRPFAIMDKEVTNELFLKFRSAHESGEVLGERLDRASQPVARVSWADAALFANWMSERAGIAPFYRTRDGKVEGFDSSATGYRLPSEAEWVWLTRSERRYAWGDFLPPPNRFGNLADASATAIVQPTLEGYDDGHAASAEVGSFPPSRRGLYDLPGNVAEWVHDVFLERLRISAGRELERVNPLGEASGPHHVIRGFGWRDASRKELSLTHRRYGRGPRDDVGFRLAHYLEAP